MRIAHIPVERFDQLDPDSVAVVCWIGKDDVLVQSGREVIGNQKLSLSGALWEYLDGRSGNSYEVLHSTSQGICRVHIPTLFPDLYPPR